MFLTDKAVEIDSYPDRHVSRAVVHGRVKTVKTEYSEDELPLDPDFATVLLAWKSRAPKSELVFPSHGPITTTE